MATGTGCSLTVREVQEALLAIEREGMDLDQRPPQSGGFSLRTSHLHQPMNQALAPAPLTGLAPPPSQDPSARRSATTEGQARGGNQPGGRTDQGPAANVEAPADPHAPVQPPANNRREPRATPSDASPETHDELGGEEVFVSEGPLVLCSDPAMSIKVLGNWGARVPPFCSDALFHPDNWRGGQRKRKAYERMRRRIRMKWWHFPHVLVRQILGWLVNHRGACSPRLQHWVPWLKWERYLPARARMLLAPENFYRAVRQTFPLDPMIGVRMELVSMHLQVKFQYGSRILYTMHRLFEHLRYYLKHGSVPIIFPDDTPALHLCKTGFGNLDHLGRAWSARGAIYDEMWYFPPLFVHHPPHRCDVYTQITLRSQPCFQDPPFFELAPWKSCFQDGFSWCQVWNQSHKKWLWGEDIPVQEIDMEDFSGWDNID